MKRLAINIYRMRALLVLLLATTLAAGLLAVTETIKPAQAAFPGANGKIAFTSLRDGNEEIYTMNPNGMGVTRLTDNTAYDSSPAFSADGTKIAFMSDRDEPQGEIYVMNADGSGTPTRLTTTEPDAVYDDQPSFSPDGSKIAFISDRVTTDNPDGYTQIFTMNAADGTGVTQLTNNSAYHYNPVFSPDGTRIAFMSEQDDPKGEIYVMNANGSGTPTRLTTNTVSDDEPSWSPDGTKIAFSRDNGLNNGQEDIYVMDPVDNDNDGNGDNLRRLTKNPSYDQSPAWSPDGRKIAFMSYRNSDWQIFVMNKNGTKQKSRTKVGEGSQYPDWGKRP